MAPVNPPAFLQAGTYSARMDRLATSALLTPDPGAGGVAVRGGVRPAPTNGMQVTQRATPGMYVTVSPGVAYVPAMSATGGCYVVVNDAPYDVAIASAHATLSRHDLIVARVYDSEYSGASNNWDLEAVTGTPAGSPVDPPVPSGAIPLARVLVAPNATQILNVNITDIRNWQVAVGGTVPCTSTARPANPWTGMPIYEMNTGVPRWWNGSQWTTWRDEGYLTTSQLAAYLSANGYVTEADLAAQGYLTQSHLDNMTWTSWTPNWGASSANPSIGNGSLVGRYFRIGKFIMVHISMNMGSTTNFGAGQYSWSVPFPPATSSTASGAYTYAAGAAVLNDAGTGQYMAVAYLFELSANNYRIRVLSGVNANSEITHNYPFTWASGDDLDIMICYQTA